jgi:DnaJ family protein C protein 11
MFPIKLSEQLMPSAVFYGTAFPMMIYFIVRKLIVDPYIKDQEDQ